MKWFWVLDNLARTEFLSGSLCHSDNSTKFGTLASIVRFSMGFKCPAYMVNEI